MLGAATAALVIVMWWTRRLSLQDVGNNLIVGLVTALVTVSLVQWITENQKRRLDGLWASEVIFLPLIDVKLLIQQAARWLLQDDPPGVEAAEKWGDIARQLSEKRERLGGILSREILIAAVELEDDLRRVDFVTARGDESRKAYAMDLFGLWNRYRHLMDRMLPPKDELRKELLVRPKELVALQGKYNLTEHGQDRDQAPPGYCG